MNDKKHISKDELIAFHNDCLDHDEKENFLEHICSCDYCSGLFAESMEGNLVSAPRSLKENLMKAARSPEMKLAKKVRETSRRMQLFLYSLKVGTATVGALIILFFTIVFNDNQATKRDLTSGSPQKPERTISLTTTIKENMDSFGNHISDLTNNILKTEVNDNEEKEK